MMTFETYRVADISTQHVTPEDGFRLTAGDCPGHVANTPEDAGTIIAIPLAELANEGLEELRQYGFSESFLGIVSDLQEQGIPYARFDKDGAPVINAPIYQW